MSFGPVYVALGLAVLLVASCCEGVFYRSDRGVKARVRILFVRHGFSCANAVSSACSVEPKVINESIDSLPFESLEAAVRRKFNAASLNRSFGIRGIKVGGSHPGQWDRDCTVRIDDDDSNLRPNVIAIDGDVVPLQSLSQDPLLTDCGLYQSKRAGSALLKHLEHSGVRIDGVVSSMLLRAIETANAMIFDPDRPEHSTHVVLSEKANFDGVVPVPYFPEVGARTAIEVSNVPFAVAEQEAMLSGRYSDRERRAIATHRKFGDWSGRPFNWDKFKAFVASVLVPDVLDGTLPPAAERDQLREALDMAGADVGELFWGEGHSYKNRHAPATREEFAGLRQSRVVTLLAVGHSVSIGQICEQEKYPRNNEVLQMDFIFRRSFDGKHVSLQQGGACSKVMDAPDVGSVFSSLVASHGKDVLSCKSPFPIAPLLSPRSPATTPTSCEALADVEDAYTTHAIA